MACLGEFGAKIAVKRAAGNFIIRQFAVEHGKAVVMFCGKDDVFHAGVADDLCPDVGIKITRIKLVVKCVILRCRRSFLYIFVTVATLTRAAPTDFLSRKTGRVVMDKHAETVGLPVVHGFRLEWGELGRLTRGRFGIGCVQYQADQQGSGQADYFYRIFFHGCLWSGLRFKRVGTPRWLVRQSSSGYSGVRVAPSPGQSFATTAHQESCRSKKSATWHRRTTVIQSWSHALDTPR